MAEKAQSRQVYAAAPKDEGHIQARATPAVTHQIAATCTDASHLSAAQQSPIHNHRKYQFVRELDKGTFGFVQLAVDLVTGEEVAIKFLQRCEATSKYVQREVMNHKRLSHPHIVQLKEVFLTRDHLAIVMEFAAGGNLYQLVSRGGGLIEGDARWYFQQLIFAVEYCHLLGVCSRDLKLENTLLASHSRPLIKLCDFGYSKDLNEHSAAGSKVGTPAYLAPEVVQATGNTPYDGRKADIWSLGVMLYAMLSADYPFSRKGEEGMGNGALRKMLQRVMMADYTFPRGKDISSSCKDLIDKILVVDPEQRITLEGIKQHPWFLTDLPDGSAHMNTVLLTHQNFY